jgi:hypothetical protein
MTVRTGTSRGRRRMPAYYGRRTLCRPCADRAQRKSLAVNLLIVGVIIALVGYVLVHHLAHARSGSAQANAQQSDHSVEPSNSVPPTASASAWAVRAAGGFTSITTYNQYRDPATHPTGTLLINVGPPRYAGQFQNGPTMSAMVGFPVSIAPGAGSSTITTTQFEIAPMPTDLGGAVSPIDLSLNEEQSTVTLAEHACGRNVLLFDQAARRAGVAYNGIDYTFTQFHEFTGCIVFSIPHGANPTKILYARNYDPDFESPLTTLWSGRIATGK